MDWIHGTFMEFLASGQMSESHVKFLVDHSDRPDVRNVCVHLVAREGTREIKSQLLTSLFKGSEPAKGKRLSKGKRNQQRLRELLALQIQDASSSPDAGPVKAVERLRKRAASPGVAGRG